MAKSVLRFTAFNLGQYNEIATIQYAFPNSYQLNQGGNGRSGRGGFTGTGTGEGYTAYPNVTARTVDTGTMPSNYTTGACTCATQAVPTSGAGSLWGFTVGDGATGAQLTFVLRGTDSTLLVYRGTASGTLIASVALGTLLWTTTAAWNVVQAAWKIHPTAGWLFFRLNGQVVLNTYSAANTNTRATANTQWNRGIIGQSGVQTTCDIAFWDMDADDPATLALDYRTGILQLASDDTKTSTPNSGTTAYSRLTETPHNGDTSYTEFTGLTEDIYNTTGSASEIPNTANIAAVQVVVLDKQSDASPVTRKVGLKSGSTSAYGATVSSPSGAYVATADRFDTDPATAAAWTPSALRAAKVLLQRVA